MTPQTIETESRSAVLHVERPGRKEPVMETQCCVCRRIRKDGEWIRPNKPLGPLVSHGYCPECHQEVLVELAQLRNGASEGKVLTWQ